MLWLRQNQIQNTVFPVLGPAIVLAVYASLPALITIMSDCAGSGSGSSCVG